MYTKGKFSVFERILSYLLSVSILFGVFIFTDTATINVYAGGNVTFGGKTVWLQYGPGDYFTDNGNACTDHSIKGIHSFTNESACNCKCTYNGVSLGACQCFGYARYVQTVLFGKNSYNSSGSFYKVSGASVSAGSLTADKLKSIIRSGNVKPGAHIRTNGSAHSMIITQITDSGFSIIQANGSNNNEYSGHNACRVGTYTYTWSSYVSSTYGSRGINYIEMPYDYNIPDNDFPGAEDTSYAVPVSLKAKYKDNTYDGSGNVESNRWIDAGDDCYIEKVYTNGFCHVEYPAGNDRRWAYAKASLFDVPKKANKPSATYVSVSAGTNFAPTSFWWNASENVDHYDLKIWNGTYWEGDAYKIEWGIKGTSCSLQLPAGYYEAYVDSVNSEGCTMSENVVRFTVGDEKIDIGTDFYAYIINTSAQKMVTVIEDNVQLQTDTGQANQVWYFERQNDLSYKISNAATNNCLDVYGYEKSNGTNIFAGCSNDQDNQRWYFTENDGNYVIHPKHAPNMAFDVNGASTEDGANIQIWETNGTSAQDFNIRYLGIPKSTTLYVFEGNNYKPTRFFWDNTDNTLYYNIKVYKDKVWDGELVASGTNLTEEFYSVNLPNGYYEAYVDSCNTFTHTMSENVVKFTIIEGTPEVIDTNFYAYIVNTATNSYLINDNGNVCFNKTNSINENQKVWYFTKNDNDSFTIKSMYDNKVLDVYMDKDENGTNVQTFNQGENYANQQWYFQGVAPYYYIKPAFTDRVVLDLNGGKYYDNVNAQVWEKNGTDAQKFKLVEVNYSISYDMNGGNGSISSQTKAYGQELILSSTIPTRNDYKFIGWNTDKNAASAQYQAGDKYTSNGNATLYAIWQINHNYTTKIFAPTCTEKGYTLHTCSVCGDSYKDTYTNATGHDFGEWIVITVPTSTNVGEEQRICSICGTVEKSSLVLKHIPGDINNDGVVNNKDFSRLFQYLSGWNVVVNEAALDVNGDGSVNNKDATRLFQYVSGWNVNIY